MGLTEREKQLLIGATDYHRKRLGITRKPMTDINQLINDLEQLCVDGSERVADLFRQLRESRKDAERYRALRSAATSSTDTS